MLTQIIWWLCNALLAILLVRSVAGRLFLRYPVFYSYIAWVLVNSLVSFYLYVHQPGGYAAYYWYSQFLSLAAGYCVLWEIYTQALADYPGAARVARVTLSLIFVVVLTTVFVNAVTGDVWAPARTLEELERNLRTVQAILLGVIIGLLSYYLIPVGRNLRGMILGYGVFVGSSVVALTLRSQWGDAFQMRTYVLPVSYSVSLLIWCVALWSYQPNPRPAVEGDLARHYEFVSAQTSKAVARARDYLWQPARS